MIETKIKKKSKREKKKMKLIKIITLLVTIPLLSSITFNAADARDCSNPKGFHATMMCKLSSFGSGSSSSMSTEGSEKKKKSGDGFWQKIKNLGGKNIGEPG